MKLSKINQAVRRKLRRLGVRLDPTEPHVQWCFIGSGYSCQGSVPTVELAIYGTEALLAHEYGHYLVDRYLLRKTKMYKQHFRRQAIKHYSRRVKYFWTLNLVGSLLKVKPKEHTTFYGLVDGEEDFCECVAAIITGRAAHNEKVAKKMKAAACLLRKCS